MNSQQKAPNYGVMASQEGLEIPAFNRAGSNYDGHKGQGVGSSYSYPNYDSKGE
jgi:hypothetical protein